MAQDSCCHFVEAKMGFKNSQISLELRDIAARMSQLANEMPEAGSRRELSDLSFKMARQLEELEMVYKPAPAARWFDLVVRLNALNPVEIGLSIIAASSLLLIACDYAFHPAHIVFAYLLPILIVANRCGGLAASVSTLASCLCAMFFFYTPRWTVYVTDGRQLQELVFFSGLALILIVVSSKPEHSQGTPSGSMTSLFQ